MKHTSIFIVYIFEKCKSGLKITPDISMKLQVF